MLIMSQTSFPEGLIARSCPEDNYLTEPISCTLDFTYDYENEKTMFVYLLTEVRAELHLSGPLGRTPDLRVYYREGW